MEEMKKVLGFDWNKEEEWEKYISELQEFYDLLVLFEEARTSLKKFVGGNLYDAVSYNREIEDVFVGGLGKPNGYQRFVRDLYGVGIDEKQFEKMSGTPKERKNAEEFKTEVYRALKIEDTRSPFATAVMEIRDKFNNARFKSNIKAENFDYKEIVEKLLKKFVNLSPLTNPKTFFINSLMYTPKFYIERMYGNTEFIESFFKWKKFTTWKDINEDYNLWGFDENSRWFRIAVALDWLYGPKVYKEYNKTINRNPDSLNPRDVPGMILAEKSSEYIKVKNIFYEYYEKKWKEALIYPPVYGKIQKALAEDESVGLYKKYADYQYIISLHSKFDIRVECYDGRDKVWHKVQLKDKVGKEPFIKYLSPQLFVKTANVYPNKEGFGILIFSGD